MPDELVLRLASGLPWQHTDVAPGKQCFETRDIAGKKSRLDHPKDCFVGQQGLGLMGRGHGYDDLRMVGGEFEALDRAEDDILEFELRLARLEPFAAVKRDP